MDVSPFQEDLNKIDAILESPDNGFSGLLKFTLNPATDLFLALKHSVHEKCFFFESKDQNVRCLGLGMALRMKRTQATRFIKENPEAIVFYQGQFEDTKAEGEYFVAEWTLIDRNGKKEAYVAPYDGSHYHSSSQFFAPEVWQSFLSPWQQYEESPEHDEWKLMIARAQARFDEGELTKIVLSRKKIFTYSDSIDAMKLFIELYEANKSSSHYTLFHQLNPTQVFISLTPEKLFSVKNGEIETISLAGSVPRGKDEKEEEQLTRELTTSAHLTTEQEAVTKEIVKILDPLCNELHVSELKAMKLPYIIHRQRDIKGLLKQEISIPELIELLHPTPAVGGTPKLPAMETIAEIEHSGRGYYAAPFGIINTAFTEIAVGIRSALIDDHVITVYGGAGIVSGADPEYEWLETGTKMQPFLKVINQGSQDIK